MSISGGSVHLGPLLADIQLKAGHFGLIPPAPSRARAHWVACSSVGKEGCALGGGLKGVNFSSGRLVQQLIHCIAMMGSDIQDRRGLDLAVNLSHRVVAIGHVEQLFNAVHQGALESAGDAIVGQETMKLAKHRGGV